MLAPWGDVDRPPTFLAPPLPVLLLPLVSPLPSRPSSLVVKLCDLDGEDSDGSCDGLSAGVGGHACEDGGSDGGGCCSGAAVATAVAAAAEELPRSALVRVPDCSGATALAPGIVATAAVTADADAGGADSTPPTDADAFGNGDP